jgi:hypothetical protein
MRSRLRSSSEAPDTSTTARATSATISVERVRDRSDVAPVRPPMRRHPGDVEATCRAGSMPNASGVASASEAAKPSVQPSSGTPATRGSDVQDAESRARSVAAATTTPPSAPAAPSSRLSTSS